MDRALQRFRRAAARENRGRVGLRRRYSPRLRQQAIEYCVARQRAGDGLRAVAAALGVAPWSLSRWRRADPAGAEFRPVAVGAATDASAPPVVTPVVVVYAQEIRVEGLDLPATAQLLRLLR